MQRSKYERADNSWLEDRDRGPKTRPKEGGRRFNTGKSLHFQGSRTNIPQAHGTKTPEWGTMMKIGTAWQRLLTCHMTLDKSLELVGPQFSHLHWEGVRSDQ